MRVFLLRDHLWRLEDGVKKRFRDFKIPKFNLLCYLFTADIDTAPEELQREHIDLKSDHKVKKMLNVIRHFSLRQQLGVTLTAIRRAISLPEILILHRQHALYYSDTPPLRLPAYLRMCYRTSPYLIS
ncbi:hypothetical protein TNCV_547681 [Trichonephila clavipes]|nr:hypothetical protein TNCV_547681 [Trichonephila clavipes]